MGRILRGTWESFLLDMKRLPAPVGSVDELNAEGVMTHGCSAATSRDEATRDRVGNSWQIALFGRRPLYIFHVRHFLQVALICLHNN